MNTNLTRSLAAAAAVATIALTAACSGGSGSDAMSASGGGGTADYQAGPQANEVPGDQALKESDAGGPTAGKGAPAANRTVVQVRSVIKTGDIAITAKDVDAARSELNGLLVTVGGAVDSEQTAHDAKGAIRSSTLVIRVPVDKFETTMTGLDRIGRKLGRVKHSDTASKDVTTQVIDVDERVQTLQNSLNRLQAYQRQATNLTDLLRFEEQITQRQSELQSMQAQQAYLSDQTAMSTISVYLATPPKHAAPPAPKDDSGFVAGLRGGWHALAASVVVVLTIVRALLPFATLLVLVGVPVWLLVRRTLRNRPPAAGPAPAEHQGM